MRENFDEIMRRELVYEGGNVDHPKDPGGRTREGVTQRVYDGYRRNLGLEPQDVYRMTASERNNIYRLQYWNVVQGDRLPAGVDHLVMDGAVNSGPLQSVKWLQRALGTVKVDGHLGQATLDATLEHPDHDALCAAIYGLRLKFLKALKTWSDFGEGWQRRINNVLAVAQAWATGSVGPAPVALAHATGVKALADDAKALPSVAVGVGTAGAGAALIGTLNDLKSALDPFFGMVPALDTIIATVGVTAAIVTAGGAAWAVYAKWKRGELTTALEIQAAA